MLKVNQWFTDATAFLAPVFTKPTWAKVQVFTVGSILAVGKRTVTALLNVVGLGTKTNYASYHHFLNRAKWSPFKAAQLLAKELVQKFVPSGPILLGIDETLERRRGQQIKAKGVYRDPVRSSKGQFVKSTGLRWMCVMLLAPVPFAQRSWALPFLTVLAPSERYSIQQGKQHRPLSKIACQALCAVKRWFPKRDVVVLADGGYAVLKLLSDVKKRDITIITRIRLDASLYELPPPPQPQKRGRPRKKGAALPKLSSVLENPKTKWQQLVIENWYGEKKRVVEYVTGKALWYKTGKEAVYGRWVLIRDPAGKFASQALFCTDPNITAQNILTWFPQRWQVEVTFQESRAHLGVETGRGWSDLTIQRTTPMLLGLFSLVTLLAQRIHEQDGLLQREQAWYTKKRLTFSDAIANVRWRLWQSPIFGMSRSSKDTVKIPRKLFHAMSDALCYAA